MSSNVKTCPACGSENGVQAKFCNGCGQPLPVEVARPTHCPGCGALLPLTGKFCNECGQKIECEPHVEKKPIHYCCSKCGNIKPTAVAFCELCGGSVQPVYAEDTTAKKAVNFAETLKGNMGKKPDVSVLFGKRKGETKAQGKKKQWWIIALAVLVIGGAAGGIGTAISEGGAGNRKAEDFISAFEKAGYTMSYDDNGMEDLREYFEGVNGIKTMAAYEGEGEVDGLNAYTYFYYVACENAEVANVVYDTLVYEEMGDDATTVHNNNNKERMEEVYTCDYSKYGNGYRICYDILSRKGNVVILLAEDCVSDSLINESIANEFGAAKAVEKLGF